MVQASAAAIAGKLIAESSSVSRGGGRNRTKSRLPDNRRPSRRRGKLSTISADWPREHLAFALLLDVKAEQPQKIDGMSTNSCVRYFNLGSLHVSGPSLNSIAGLMLGNPPLGDVGGAFRFQLSRSNCFRCFATMAVKALMRAARVKSGCIRIQTFERSSAISSPILTNPYCGSSAR